MNINEKQGDRTDVVRDHLNIMFKVVSWCVMSVVSGFLTLAIAICDSALKSAFDKKVELVAVSMTGFVFIISIIMCTCYIVRSKKESQ